MDGLFVVFVFAVSEPSVVIKVRFSALQIDRCRKALYCLVEVPHAVKRNTFIVVGERVLGLNFDSLRVVLNGKFKLTELVVSKASIEQSLEMIRENVKCL